MIAYYVQPGDTLSSIAQQFGVSMQTIQTQNNLSDTVLLAGQLLMIPVGTGSIPPANTFPYVVQRGDSLFLIARRFNVPYESVLALNPLPNPSLIYPGQVVYLPLASSATLEARRCPEGTTSYIIQPGDTLSAIALRFGIGIQVIMQYNAQITNPDVISAGDTLCLPQSNTCPVGSFAYIVKPGDSLSKIANEFQVSLPQLIENNAFLSNGNLIVGQLLCVPEQQVIRCPAGQFGYLIQPGDTIYQLARMFETTVEVIFTANPGVDPDHLIIGETLCIPERGGCPVGAFGYIVQPGDTLFKLAQRFETTVMAIEALNSGLDPMRLITGQSLCIPEPQPTIVCPIGSSPYAIKTGDTLASLAARQNVRPEVIEDINPDVDFAALHVGIEICLPQRVYKSDSDTEDIVAGKVAPPKIEEDEVSAPIETQVHAEIAENEPEIVADADDTTDDLQLLDETIESEATNEDVILDAPPAEDLPERMSKELLDDASEEDAITRHDMEVGPPRAPSFRPFETDAELAPRREEVTCQTAPLQVRRCPAGAVTYTVQSGDTFTLLATRFQASVQTIQTLNPDVDPLNLIPGEVICVPSLQNMNRYVVLIGDSLYLIARKFGLTVEQILAVNPQITDPNRLFPGQIIWIAS